MADVLCGICNELNDSNSVKCESCKASFIEDQYAIDDECENDYRFIEEAESKNEFYKLEIVEDSTFLVQEIPETRTTYDFKIENEISVIDDIREYNQTPKGNNNEDLETDIDCTNLKNSFNLESSEIQIPGVPYQCNKCPKSFKRKATLKAHINRFHNPDDTSECFESFAYETKSKSDSKRTTQNFSDSCDSEYVPPQEDDEYRTQTKQLRSPVKTKRKAENSSDESDYENNNTRKKATSRSKTNASPSQTLLDLKNNKPNLKRHMVYKCTACEKITNNYEEHINHILIHEAPMDSLTETTSLKKLQKTPSGFLKCTDCERIFMSRREYEIHKKMDHGGVVFQCDICEAFLFSQSTLRKHKARMHKRKKHEKKDNQFECITCHEKFDAQLLLTHHRKVHEDEIKKIEQMTVIERSGTKPTYVCKICAKTSKNKYRHEEHLRIHTKEKPFKCKQCGESISTANALVHHLRLHENDRPFKCDVCKATYRHKKSLKKHLRHHTGERPFTCRSCDKTFVFNYTRASHERNCHLRDGRTRNRRRRSIEDSETNVPDATINEDSNEAKSPVNLEEV